MKHIVESFLLCQETLAKDFKGERGVSFDPFDWCGVLVLVVKVGRGWYVADILCRSVYTHNGALNRVQYFENP